MTSENKISADVTLNLDDGGLRIEAVGDALRLTILKQSPGPITIADDEIRAAILAIRAVANAAGAEAYRRFEASRQAYPLIPAEQP